MFYLDKKSQYIKSYIYLPKIYLLTLFTKKKKKKKKKLLVQKYIG